MWPKSFEYERASSIDDALAILNGDAKILAGGHSLLPAMKLRLSEPAKLVDIGRIDALKGISANESLTIGALTTHAEIAASSLVQSMCPALATAAGGIGDQGVRNFGTLGGNIAHADPASDPPTVLVACDATINIKGSDGERTVHAGDFFVDLFTTDLEEGELITSVSIPNQGGKKSAYAKLTHPASRYALVGVCAVLDMDGATCRSASVVVGGATVKAVRCTGAEEALMGTICDDAAIESATQAIQADIANDLMGDVNYPAAYRQAMAGVYLKRAIKDALG